MPHSVCKHDKGRPGSIYHVNDINIYLGRQRGAVGPQQAATFLFHECSGLQCLD